MTVRRKLLVLMPLLVAMMSVVMFLVFRSGQLVQDGYELMMNRILLYQETVQATEKSMAALNDYLVHPAAEEGERADQALERLGGLRAALAGQARGEAYAAVLKGHSGMLATFEDQAGASLAASRAGQSALALDRYKEAETTFGYIREGGQRLADQELAAYRPLYAGIQAENGRLYRLGIAVFAIGALLSAALAVWVSRSVTEPVNRLVQAAEAVSAGNLEPDLPGSRSGSELDILTASFRQMLEGLRASIAKDRLLSEQEKLVKTLELQALQSQINPHFLFNTLNTLSKMALLEGADKTSGLIVRLSQLLRYNLRSLDADVTLREELAHVQAYLTIQEARFRGRVKVEFLVEEEALDTRVPSLLLQPLVENAFVHGVEGMESGGRITVGMRREGEGAIVEVADNGRGMPPETREALLGRGAFAVASRSGSTGLGVRNVFRRLELAYGRPDLVEIDSSPGEGTAIRLLLPFPEPASGNSVGEESTHANKRGDAHVQAVDRG